MLYVSTTDGQLHAFKASHSLRRREPKREPKREPNAAMARWVRLTLHRINQRA